MPRAVAQRLLILTALAAPWLLQPSHAAAGGLEYSAAGATALGRGGAVTARADDPMVLAYNPAGLVELQGTQLLIDVNLALMSACVDPIGYYGWGAYGGGGPSRFTDEKTGSTRTYNLGRPGTTDAENADLDSYYKDPLDTVCMNQHVVPVPQLAVTHRFSKAFGIGGGLIFPAISPTGQWGDDNGLIRGNDGDLRPAATRFMQLNTGNLGVFPTIGAAYRITDWLRIGASFEWGIVWVDTTTMAGIGTGTSPSNDVIAHIRARDMFVPGATFSVHIVPTDSLDIVGAFRYEDQIQASGKLNLETGVFDANAVPYMNRDLKVTSVNQKMPWKFRGGIRYADRLVPRPTGTGNETGLEKGNYGPVVHDAFQDERWDIEIDGEYQMNARNKEQVIKYQQGQAVQFQSATGGITMSEFPDLTVPDTTIEKHWKNQLSVRAGGSYNIVPGLFGVMGGVHYETRGIDPSYMQIDFWPVSRLGFHGGVTFRVAGTTDIVFSYAHIFQETITVAPPAHLDANTISMNTPLGATPKNIDKSVGIPGRSTLPPTEELNPPKNPDGTAKLAQVSTKVPSGQPRYIINSGTYRSDMDVFSVGIHAHF